MFTGNVVDSLVIVAAAKGERAENRIGSNPNLQPHLKMNHFLVILLGIDFTNFAEEIMGLDWVQGNGEGEDRGLEILGDWRPEEY